MTVEDKITCIAGIPETPVIPQNKTEKSLNRQHKIIMHIFK